MSIFGSIMEKIFHPANAATPASDAPGSASAAGSAAAATAGSVDVEQVLTQLASQKGGGGNWQTSIVDLLKLLDLDSSLSARKELANEINVHAGADGTAEQNIALHAGVLKKLEENGGKVPDSLKGHA
nr:DUF3597 domain-containing protein [uncultured Rhodopila sp.]